MTIEDRDQTIQLALRVMIHDCPSTGPDDPLLVLFWNDQRLLQLPANAKQVILDLMVNNGGERMPASPDRLVFYRDPSLLAQCRVAMKRQLPWAFVAGPETAAILGVPPGVPVAETVVVYRTERTKPDVSHEEFFYA